MKSHQILNMLNEHYLFKKYKEKFNLILKKDDEISQYITTLFNRFDLTIEKALSMPLSFDYLNKDEYVEKFKELNIGFNNESNSKKFGIYNDSIKCMQRFYHNPTLGYKSSKHSIKQELKFDFNIDERFEIIIDAVIKENISTQSVKLSFDDTYYSYNEIRLITLLPTPYNVSQFEDSEQITFSGICLSRYKKTNEITIKDMDNFFIEFDIEPNFYSQEQMRSLLLHGKLSKEDWELLSLTKDIIDYSSYILEPGKKETIFDWVYNNESQKTQPKTNFIL